MLEEDDCWFALEAEALVDEAEEVDAEEDETAAVEELLAVAEEDVFPDVPMQPAKANMIAMAAASSAVFRYEDFVFLIMP